MNERRRPLGNQAWTLGIAAACLLGFGGALLIALGHVPAQSTGPDAWWGDLVAGVEWPPLTGLAMALNLVGGTKASIGIVALTAVALLVARKYWSAVFLVVASLGGFAAVQAVKNLVARPRPEQMMVTSDFGAFPSGHSAHAAVFVVALALIFAAHRWIVPVAAIYVLLMMWSRTHVHAHWLTDTIGGALLGVGVTLIVWAALAGRVRGEWTGSVQGDDSRVQAGGVEQPQHVRDE